MTPSVGQSFGLLKVLSVEKSGRGYIVRCRCRCGDEITVRASKLTRKTTGRTGSKGSCGARACNRKYQRPDGPAFRVRRGYKELIVCRRWKFEHRAILEEHLGRKLNQNEHVHHINGDRLDNRLENLAVIEQSNHSKKHGDLLREIAALRKETEWLRKQLAALHN